MLRKILAICLRKRTNTRIDAEIPPSQAAYRAGRSTTEHVFATKILCEKAITSTDFSIYLLLLDMSKAFDTVNRTQLIQSLKRTLEYDEIALIIRLLNTELTVRCGKDMSSFFKTDTGVPQGDSFSALQFTYYLAIALLDEEEHEEHNYAVIINPTSIEHAYATSTENVEVDIDMEYADDLTNATTSSILRELKKKETPGKLKKKNLTINSLKTEEFDVTRNGCDKWRKCLLLGSYLGTEQDIKRRKGLSIAAIRSKKDIFYGKLDVQTKMRGFNCYAGNVFLYNCELWGLTKTQLNAIDAFHRRLLRTAVLNIRYPRTISSQKLYEVTNATPWSEIITFRALSWFGHLYRLDKETPARKALEVALQESKKPRGQPVTTWISYMKKLLLSIGLSWERAAEIAQDRKEWNDMIG